MSKNINLSLSALSPRLKKPYQFGTRHVAFGAIIIVLLVYVFMVMRISSLTGAEPKPEDEAAALAETNIPKINKDAVLRIQSLEEGSAEIQSLFDAARTNPFLE